MPPLLYLLIVIVNPINGAVWSAQQAAKLSQDIMNQDLIPCAVVLHSGQQIPQKIYSTVNKMQKTYREKFHTVTTVAMTKFDDFNYPGTNPLFILFADLPNSKDEFQNMINNTEYSTRESTWLILLPTTISRDEFLGPFEISFLWRVLVASRSDSFSLLREAWRVALGYPLRTEFYASWTEKNGLKCKRDNCLHHQKSDLEGFPMRASTKEDMPLSRLTQEDGTLKIEGYFGDVYYDLLSRLNATPRVVHARENFTGSATNGTWNGLIGMLERNEIDMAVGPLSVHRISLDVIDFVRPLLRTNYQVFFKQSGTVVEWDAFLKPFAKYVWRLIILSIIIAAVYLHFFYRIGVRNRLEDGIYSWEYNMINSYFTFIKALCHQGTDLMPSSLSCRVLYLTGCLTFLILHTAYSAALISKLTTQEPLRPFDSLESFHKDGSYKLTAIGRSTDYTYFSEATDATLKSIYERQMLRSDLPTGKEEGLMVVCDKDKTALFITYAVTQISAGQISASRKCPILVFKNPLGIVSLTIGIRKKMPFIPLITQKVQEMAEQGILRRMLLKEWPPYPSITTAARTSQVEIQQVAQIHIVFIIGIVLSVIILICEIMHASPTTAKIRTRLLPRGYINSDYVTGTLFWILAVYMIVTVISSFV